MIECIAGVVRRQIVPVQRLVALPPDDRARGLEQANADRTRNVLLRARHVGIEVAAVGREPQAVVHQVGVLSGEAVLEPRLLLGEAHALERAVGHVERDGSRSLVQLARLDADQPVLHVIDAPHAVASGDIVHQLDERHAIQALAVDRDGDATLEADLYLTRGVGRVSCGHRPGIRLFWRRDPRVFQVAGLDAASPKVLVDRVRAPRVQVQRDVLLQRVGDLLLARHVPLACRSDDLELGSERRSTDVESHLVVALACATVRDRECLLFLRNTDEVLCDQRATERRREGVHAFVERSSLESGPDVLSNELVADVDDVGALGADLQRTLPRGLEVDLAAEIHGERSYV